MKTMSEYQKKRKEAYAKSDLPYCFDYKIKWWFENKPCPLCGFEMNNISKYIHSPTIQHNTPISKGGKHDIKNISVICNACNITIRDKETPSLNNNDVVNAWNQIQKGTKKNKF